MWDKEKALATLHSRAHKTSYGRCAEYTRIAIEAGGVTLKHHLHAKDYGSSLEAVGFVKVPSGHRQIQTGDVGIVQAIPGHPDGHMAMFDGNIWISDFEQQHGLYPADSYRKLKPPFDIYRYRVLWDAAGTAKTLNLA